MNPLPDELTEQRLSRELRAAAHAVELTPGSELAVVTTGRRRRQRRRQVTTVAVVTALAGGTAVAIQQLAGDGGSSIATETPSSDVTGSTVDATTPNVIVVVDPSVPASSAPGSVPGSIPDTAAGDQQPQPVEAELVESNVAWVVVEPDSTEAVAYGEYPSPPAIPGVMLATAPGRNDDYEPQFWRTEDGVTWTPFDVELPFGRPGGARFDAGRVYAVGTAPGIAKTDPNPMLFGVSGDDGVTWDQVELPIDTNDGRDLPFVRGASAYATVYPIDDGAVVWVNSMVELDYDAVFAAAGVEPNDNIGSDTTRDGIYVPSDPDCQPSYEMFPMATTAPYGVAPTTVLSDPADVGGCERVLVEWSEIGVPQETVDRVFAPNARAFRVIDGEVTEIEVPEGIYGADGGTVDEQLFGNHEAGDWYRLDRSTGKLVPTEYPGDGVGWVLGSNESMSFVQREARSAPYSMGGGVVIGSSSDRETWQYADWSGLVGEGRVGWSQSTAVTGVGLVQSWQVQDDPIAAQGGVSVSSGGYTISRSTSRSDIVVTDDATGETVDLRHLMVGGRGLVITDADGNEVARLDENTFAPVLYDMGGVPGQSEYVLATSSDGVHVAVESVADLLGVNDSDISSIPRISAAGDKTVVAVTLKERNAEGVPRQLVLVGTPRT